MISHIGNTAAQGKITKVLKLLVNYTIDLFLGHYVSYITDRNGKNRWSCFDDSNVSIIETNPIGSTEDEKKEEHHSISLYRKK